VVLFQKLITVISPDGYDEKREGSNAPSFGTTFTTTTTTTTAAPVDGSLPTMVEAAAAKVLNVEEAFKQCLGARLGTDAVAGMDLKTLLPGARRRLEVNFQPLPPSLLPSFPPFFVVVCVFLDGGESFVPFL
jgi:hypothetical protein